MCDSHRAGAGLLACGFQALVPLSLCFPCLLLVEVTAASTAQQTCLGHLSSDTSFTPGLRTSFPTDSPQHSALFLCFRSYKIPPMTREGAQEVTEQSRSPTFDSCCLSGLTHWWLQGVQCMLQAEQGNPDWDFLAFQTGGVLDFGLTCG